MNKNSELSTPRLQHRQHHILQAGNNKTNTKATACNRLRTQRPTHGERNPKHVIYRTAQDNLQLNRRRRT